MNDLVSTRTDQTRLNEVIEIINQLARKTHSVQYIFRGESERHQSVSSSLYRQYAPGIDGDHFDPERIQRRILRRSKPYTDETEDLEILSQLQHYGGKTNLIDFTTDYLIALYFACYASPTKDGRVVLLSRHGELAAHIKAPRRTANRVIAQHSIFVLPPEGYIEHYDVVNVPGHLKQTILAFLSNCHDISAETVFNDLHGFIRLENIRHRASAELKSGLSRAEKGDYEKAIDHYTAAIEFDPQMTHAYVLRGNVYRGTGKFDRAIQDYSHALNMDPEEGHIYYHRGDAFIGKGEVERGIRDYTQAISLDPNDLASYHHRAVAYVNLSQFDLAMDDCNRIIEADPKHYGAYNCRVIVHINEGGIDQAVEDCTRMIGLNPENPVGFYYRAMAYVSSDQAALAVVDCDRMIELAPARAEGYYYRAMACLMMERFDCAISDFDKAIDIDPCNVHAYCNRG